MSEMTVTEIVVGVLLLFGALVSCLVLGFVAATLWDWWNRPPGDLSERWRIK